MLINCLPMQLNFCIYALFFTRFIVEMRKKIKNIKNTVFFEKNMFVCFLSKKNSFFPHPATYAIFFFSRPFNENFSKTVHTILHSHPTPKGAPACAKASKSYDWNVRNIAKISPKMAKKQPFFDFLKLSIGFFDFLKLSIRLERNFLQSFFTP